MGGTTSDQVIVAGIREDMNGLTGADDVTVFNADGHTVALDMYTLLTSTGITAATDTFSIKRIPQTLILDSTGATSTSASSRDFNPGTIATTNNTDSEFREVMHVGVALKASSDSGAAALSRVNVSFAETDPLKAAQKIQSAIEEQLGGEYRKGGSLHIDVTAVSDVYKIQNASITSGTDTSNTYPDRLFGNSLTISNGEHGNDKFLLTIDGEEVEVDLDGDFASSTNERISTLVTASEAQTIGQANTSSAFNASVFRMGISDATP